MTIFDTPESRARRRHNETKRTVEVIAKLTGCLDAAVDERDEAQEALSQIYYVVTGRSPEWSNNFGVAQAVEELTDAVNVLKQSARR